jgi:hypothetical protein
MPDGFSRNKAYYNLRKRYGHEEAKKIVGYWLHYHLELPQDAEEALMFFLGVGK